MFNATIFGLFNLTAIVLSFCGSWLILPYCSRLRIFAIGSAIQGAAIAMMGCIGFISKNWLFLILAHICRICQGLGESLIFMVIYSLLAATKPGNLSLYSTLLSTFEYMGSILGPFSGAFLYRSFGYLGPFLIMGAASMISFLVIFIPKESQNS